MGKKQKKADTATRKAKEALAAIRVKAGEVLAPAVEREAEPA